MREFSQFCSRGSAKATKLSEPKHYTYVSHSSIHRSLMGQLPVFREPLALLARCTTTAHHRATTLRCTAAHTTTKQPSETSSGASVSLAILPLARVPKLTPPGRGSRMEEFLVLLHFLLRVTRHLSVGYTFEMRCLATAYAQAVSSGGGRERTPAAKGRKGASDNFQTPHGALKNH